MFRRSMGVCALCAAIGLGATGAGAAEPNTGAAAAAEALFQEGRALLMAGKIDEACPKLAESQRLDPATGTLMALALCQEQQGKLASAWSAFADVEARSRLEGRADRERTAREHGGALRPRLSTLTVEVPPQIAGTPGLTIAIDGVPIGRGAWNTPIPVDGGDHFVETTAPGRPPWKTSLTVRSERDVSRVAVVVPPAPADPAPALVARPTEPAAPASQGGGGGRRTIGLVVLGAGMVTLGTSLFLGLDARSDYDAAVAGCMNGMCAPEPYGRVQDAQDQGDLATLLAIVGGAAAAAGAAFWLWPSESGGGARSSAASVQAFVTTRSFGLKFRF
jgi:hypothetical protein